MPGPKMGPRPPDFDEVVIKKSPTYVKWGKMHAGQKLRYACREFIKGKGDDDERLMRRILIARRNNVRDHETLKRARRMARPKPPTATTDSSKIPSAPPLQQEPAPVMEPSPIMPQEQPQHQQEEQHVADSTQQEQQQQASYYDNTNHPSYHHQHHHHNSTPAAAAAAAPLTDRQVMDEMDVEAVEATRSYRNWSALRHGQEFVYNQRYIKGHDGHDWLLRKNIWRRMRYRRENKRLVAQLREQQQQHPNLHHHDRHHDHHMLSLEAEGDHETPSVKAPPHHHHQSLSQIHPPAAPSTKVSVNQAMAATATPLDAPRQHETTSTNTPGATHRPMTNHHREQEKEPMSHHENDDDDDDHHHHASALQQASAAAAAAILGETPDHNVIIMDPAAVEAAVAAAESFQQRATTTTTATATNPLGVHDPVAAVAEANRNDEPMMDHEPLENAASASNPAKEEEEGDLEQQRENHTVHVFAAATTTADHNHHHSTPTLEGTAAAQDGSLDTLVTVHDPLQAAALAAQLAQVSGEPNDAAVAVAAVQSVADHHDDGAK